MPSPILRTDSAHHKKCSSLWRGAAANSGGGAGAPEEIGGEAKEKEQDGDLEVDEFFWVAESEIDCVANDGRGGQNKDKRRPRIARNAIGYGTACPRAANGENGQPAQSIKDPANENDPADEFREFARGSKDGGPHTECDDRGRGRLETRMNLGQLFEEEVIVGHGVEDARGGENHAVGGAGRGDEDGEGKDELVIAA